MELRVCELCKHMFNYVAGSEVCPKCKQVEEEKLEAVKAYLTKNPEADEQMIVQEVEVKSHMLLRFLKEGKLELTEESPIVLKCERCGKRIYSGVRCQECSFEMSLRINQLKHMALN